MDNAELVDLAILMNALDQSPDDPVLSQRVGAGLDRCDCDDYLVVLVAKNLLEGLPYPFTTDAPEGVLMRRFRSLAAHMGGTVTVHMGTIADDEVTTLRFNPPGRH